MGTPGRNDGEPAKDLLEGWAAISGYLEVTTRAAQRWEKSDPPLPIHRDGNGRAARVFAYKGEIDRWRAGRRQAPRTTTRRPVLIALALAGVFVVGIVVALIVRNRPQPHPTPPSAADRPSRLFWRVSSENGALWTLRFPGRYNQPWPTAGGERLYAGASKAKELYILDTRSGDARVIDLPEFPWSAVADESRKLAYVGTSVGKLIIVDLETARVREVMHLGSPVNDLTLTPDGESLFLALMHGGAKRLRLFPERELKVISTDACPAFVRLDRTGERLAVSYQCGGPRGREGHDAVEIFDARDGRLLDSFVGPPLVGGEHQFSPDGRTLWMDGGDACSSDRYDREGCLQTPSRVAYVYRLADRKIVKTFALPITFLGNRTSFLGSGNAALFSSQFAEVYRTSNFALIERWKLPTAGSALASADGRRVFFLLDGAEVEVVDVEPPSCSELGVGAIHHLAVDGATGDRIENARIVPEEGAQYAAGFVGQALQLHPSGTPMEIRAPSTHNFGHLDSSIAFYVKMERSPLPIPILEYRLPTEEVSWRLMVNTDGRLGFSFRGEKAVHLELRGTSDLAHRKWHHIALTKTAQAIRLFVDGELHAEGTSLASLHGLAYNQPVRLGWSAASKGRLEGLLDEMVMWNRALEAGEVRELFRRRLEGECKP
ncbi:MAG: LamG domain-containing protein [Bryobacterales bacterium]|nr:LamG domain-containing protein [Bryobacterales bacterium]